MKKSLLQHLITRPTPLSSYKTLLTWIALRPSFSSNARLQISHPSFFTRSSTVAAMSRPRMASQTATDTSTSTSSPIVRFYDPHIPATDSRYRTLTIILQWSNDRLEHSHDYIQWLFPLPERSPIAPSAPVVDRETFLAFRSRPELQDRLRNALVRICRFYGFEARGGGSGLHGGGFRALQKLPDPEFRARSRVWVSGFSHNHLRITRIIRSLRVLGLEEEARVFFAAVEGVYEDTGKIGQRSLMFWQRAVERPLYLAPEDEVDEGMGKDFLYKYEKEKAQMEEDQHLNGRLEDPDADRDSPNEEDSR